VSDDEIERRLHDLTLDFGITTRDAISRPLQLKELGRWRLNLWVPLAMHKTEKSAASAFRERRLPVSIAASELHALGVTELSEHDCRLVCDTFLQARDTLRAQAVATILPDFLESGTESILDLRVRAIDLRRFSFRLAWNPRLLRLNPHAGRRKDFLVKELSDRMVLAAKHSRLA